MYPNDLKHGAPCRACAAGSHEDPAYFCECPCHGPRQLFVGVIQRDVPDEARGLTVQQWQNYLWDQSKAEVPPPTAPPELLSKAVATPRTRYGWRGIVGGGASLLFQGGKESK